MKKHTEKRPCQLQLEELHSDPIISEKHSQTCGKQLLIEEMTVFFSRQFQVKINIESLIRKRKFISHHLSSLEEFHLLFKLFTIHLKGIALHFDT